MDTIVAPLFPTGLPWANVVGREASIIQRGKPLLIEFWDFCRPNSLRTLPYLQAWHERYAEAGLRTVGVHSPGFEPARDEDAVRAAVTRLGIEYPVLIDRELELWRDYENQGWPARYLFDGRARLFEYHYGEGAYAETELAIQELLGVEREPLAPLRPEDAPGAAARAADRGPGGRLLRPVRGRRRVGGAGRVGDRARQRQRDGEPRSPPRRLPPDRARTPHRRRAGVGDRPGRAVLRDVLHAGLGVGSATLSGASSAWAPSPSRRCSRGGPESSTITHMPGQ